MITIYQANKLNDFLFGETAFTPSATYYLGLSTSTINPDGSGVTEPTGSGYARVPIENNKTNFSNSAGGVLNNEVTLTFPESTASWGTVTYVLLADSQTGGNVLYFDALTTPRIVQSATTVLFLPNTLQIQLS